MVVDRQSHVVRLHPADESGHYRSLRPRRGRREGDRHLGVFTHDPVGVMRHASRLGNKDVATKGRARSTAFCCTLPETSSGYLFNLLYLWDEMAKQVLDTVLQRGGRRWTAGTGALHVQEHDAVFVAAERDVATVLRHRRTHAR